MSVAIGDRMKLAGVRKVLLAASAGYSGNPGPFGSPCVAKFTRNSMSKFAIRLVANRRRQRRVLRASALPLLVDQFSLEVGTTSPSPIVRPNWNTGQ
jgi:hypothetical protein